MFSYIDSIQETSVKEEKKNRNIYE